jgi:hypothetical protein
MGEEDECVTLGILLSSMLSALAVLPFRIGSWEGMIGFDVIDRQKTKY